MCVMEQLDLELYCKYLESARNPSDYWTRICHTAEWSFKPEADLLEAYRPTVDRFATPGDAVVRRFNCPYRHPAAEAADALTQDWSGEMN